ncbi:unnamed protein product [Larinioides sclopetarius]|uniref:UNC93-like protein n=1 Tax=Larinioides sclopetarius TaxID=280406 RepID=A0AAV2AUS8_9ARAC
MTETASGHLLPDVTVNGLGQNPCINENDENINLAKQLNARAQRRRCIWNMFVFSVCYFLTFTGFWALSNLQSTMNAAGGIGDYSQAVIYVTSMFSSLFLPKMFIEKFGCKTLLAVGTLACCFTIASNMYLNWGLMMTASAVAGLVNGPYISAQTLYIDETATRFQSNINENLEFIMAAFFGVFMFFMESTQVWGNLISYFVLSNGKPPEVNASTPLDCGVNFFPSKNESNKNLDPPSEEQRLLLTGIFLAMGLLAFLILLAFLEPLKNDLKVDSGCRSVGHQLISAFRRLQNPQQLLLIPLTLYIGLEGPFYAYDITQAYIACSWGVHHVGFVTVCFGVCGALMSLLVGPLVKYISQMAVLILAAVANVSICIVLFLWDPTPDFKTMYFVIAGVWGMGDAIWWSQVTALYGLMFPNDREAAFSNLYFWSFLGFFLSYSYANYFTVAVKINILLCFLFVGMLGYMIGQIKLKSSSRTDYVPIPDGGDSS